MLSYYMREDHIQNEEDPKGIDETHKCENNVAMWINQTEDSLTVTVGSRSESFESAKHSGMSMAMKILGGGLVFVAVVCLATWLWRP